MGRISSQRPGGWFWFFLLALAASERAGAIMVMSDKATKYENPSVTGTDYLRYENLANQDRYDNVGQLRLSWVGDANSISHCSGTLISFNVVLTAAHCLYSPNAGPARFDPGTGSAVNGYALKQGAAMSFWTGPQIGANPFIGYPVANVTYSGYIDRVLPHPNYVHSSSGGSPYDIALVRLSATAPFAGQLPTVFPAISTSVTDLSGPDPWLANAVGYGNWGTGNTGQKDNLADVKRAGIVSLNTPSSASNEWLLYAKFYTGSELKNQGFPASFLQGALAQGDSGGPLFYNFGPNPGSIVGVANAVATKHDIWGNDTWGFGQVSIWTAVAPHAAWLNTSGTSLALAGGFLVAGLDPANPLLPSWSSVDDGVKSIGFDLAVVSADSAMFVDPVIGTMAEVVASGASIDGLLLPATYGSSAKVLVFNEVSGGFVDLGYFAEPGSWLEFEQPSPRLQILGDGSVDELVVGFSFASAGAVNLVWASAVPDAPAHVLWLLGIGALIRLRRRGGVPWSHGIK